MLLLHNTIPLICCLVEKIILPLQEFWRIYPADAWLHSAAAESCSAAGNPISQARDPYCGRRILFCWLLLVLNHISQSHEIACLNTNENDSSEESCEAIKFAVMPVFGILKHLIEVSKTFSAHSNLSSHSLISDTFVLYIQSILLINWKQVAPKYL